MTKQMMIDKIYDIIPYYNETLYRCNRVWEAWNYGTMTRDDFEEVKPSIMLGDVLYWIENNLKKTQRAGQETDYIYHGGIFARITMARDDYRKPIEEQPDILIEYIHGLLIS